MDTTTNPAGAGSTIGKSFYLKNAKAIIIEITVNLAADDTTCHSMTVSNYYTFPAIRTNRIAGVLKIFLI